MVCRCPRCVQQLGPQGDRHAPAAKCGAAGAPAPLSQNRSACRSRKQTGIGSVCASALCCHPADPPLSTSPCPHGQNIGKRGTGKRRNGGDAEAFSIACRAVLSDSLASAILRLSRSSLCAILLITWKFCSENEEKALPLMKK